MSDNKTNQFIVTESFLSDHTNVDIPSWLDVVIKEGNIIWASNGRVYYKRPNNTYRIIELFDVFIKNDDNVALVSYPITTNDDVDIIGGK